MREITQYNLHELLQSGTESSVCVRETRFTALTLPLSKLGGGIFLDCAFENVVFEGPNDRPIVFVRGSIHGGTFDKARFSNLSFDGVTIDRTSFRQTDLSNASFESTTLSNADFRCARLTNVRFSDTTIDGVSFDYADVTAGLFQKVTLNGDRNSFGQAKLKGVVFLSCSFTPNLFDPALTTMDGCLTVNAEAPVVKAAPPAPSKPVAATPVIQPPKEIQITPPSRFKCIPLPDPANPTKVGV